MKIKKLMEAMRISFAQLQVVEEETQEIVDVAHGGLHQVWQSGIGQRALKLVHRVDKLWHRSTVGSNFTTS